MSTGTPGDGGGEAPWTICSHADIAQHLLPMTAQLVDAVGVDADESVLDVGCGTGSVCITAT